MDTFHVNPDIGDRGAIDVFLPDGGGLQPFVLVVHGGGWSNGDRTSLHWVADRLLPHGLAVVTCSYRISQEMKFPACYDDLIFLLRWLGSNGESVGLKSDRCVLLGSSAGGHLVTLLATRGIQEHGAEIIDIAGVVAYCPATDLRMQYEHDCVRDATVTEGCLGDTPNGNPRIYREASPVDWVFPGSPPLWVAHGDEDGVVPITQTHTFVEAWLKTGQCVDFHIAAGAGHTMIKPASEPNVLLAEDKAVQFIHRCLGAGLEQ